jgi:hypothetical protein
MPRPQAEACGYNHYGGAFTESDCYAPSPLASLPVPRLLL